MQSRKCANMNEYHLMRLDTMSHTRAYPLQQQIISVTGQDQLSYLHGQLTQDLNLVTEQQFLWAGHCSPKGKLWGAFKLFKFQDGFHLLGGKAECEASCRELKKYGVFANVDINMPEAPRLFGLLTDDLDATCATLNVHFDEQSNSCAFEHGVVLKLDTQRLIVYLTDEFALPESFLVQDNSIEFDEASILAAEPQLDADHIEEFVPQMVNLQAIGGISFKKGCYTGQETVARMRYLGKNKRAMYVVQGQSDEAINDTDLEVQLEQNWRRAGKIIHQVYNPNSKTYSALAVLPNDTEQTAILRLKHSEQSTVLIQALPYSLEDQ